MARTRQNPASLDGLKYFVVRYHREAKAYELCLPSTADTFMLGREADAAAYFRERGIPALGERAMAAAQSFGASQALIEENRAFALDLTKLVGSEEHRADQRLDRERLFGEDDDGDVYSLKTGKDDNDRVAIA